MTREELITKLQEKDFTLSFTSICAFAQSPAHFINYKLGDRVETPAMKKGSLIHCAILEPEELEKKYCILERNQLPNPEADFRNSENKKFKQEFEQKAEAEGKIIIDPNEWDNALKHRDLAYSNEVIAPYLKNLRHTEFSTTWDFEGFKWRGIIDGLGKGYVLDLKTTSDASPERHNYNFRDGKYHWQQFLYRQSDFVPFYYEAFNLLVDGDGISLLKIEYNNIYLAESQLKKILDKFKMCLDNNLWHQNYEFWAENQKGYFILN